VVNLEIFGPDGSLLGNAPWQLDKVLPSSGTYTIIVGDNNTSDSGTYDLTVGGCYLSPNNPDVHYTYDQLGRLIGVLYPSGKQITYTYDERGNRIQETVVGGN
jgi:YD repeat-containing protein